jgi:hypothetical protein
VADFFPRREVRDRRPNEEERATMTSWRLGFLPKKDAIERIGAERFNELLTPRERAEAKVEAMKGRT